MNINRENTGLTVKSKFPQAHGVSSLSHAKDGHFMGEPGHRQPLAES